MIRPALLALLLASPLPAPAAPILAASKKAHAVAHLQNLAGKPVGIADFSTINHGLLIVFDLHDLPPGPHGVHLHVSGNCAAKTGFTSAGPIL